jgi:hypothetical protein
MIMATRTRPSYIPGNGVDYRVDAERRAHVNFSASVWRNPDQSETAARCVEVQAYVPLRDDGRTIAVVAIVLHSGYGIADLMLSADEARELAIALIQSAAEADAL